MVLLGVLLILIALVVVAYMWFGTQGLGPLEIDLGIFTAILTPLQIFLTGVASILVLSTGSALLAAGLARKRARRSEVKALRRQVSHDDRTNRGREDRDDDRDRPTGDRDGRSGATDAETAGPRGEEVGHRDGDERPAGERGDDRRAGGIDPTAFRP